MNSRERRTARYRAKCAAEASLERNVGAALSGCSSRVYKAVNSLSARTKSEASADNICLPQVAIYNAGHRTVRKDVYHVVK